jgi:erythromycin esterase
MTILRLAAVPTLAATLALAPGGDPRLDALSAIAIPVRSIDPADVDFADLEPLAAKIGAARIVALGEATHGDGATLSAKTRLVRFLHERMGFDVVAWESGLFDVRLAEAALHGGGDASAAAAEGIFDIWANATQCAPLFEYARSTHATARPLVMAGLDPQYGGATTERYANEVGALLGDVLPAERRAFALDVRGRLEAALASRKPEEHAAFVAQVEALVAAIDAERARLETRAAPSEIDFLRHTLRGLVAVSKMMEGMQANLGPKAMNPRAEAMARNVAFLAEEYCRGRKILLWSNTFHALRAPEGIEVPGRPGRFDGVRPMGQHLAERFGEDLYSIAFVSARGKSHQIGTPAPVDIAEASAESFEGLCAKSGKPYLFVDLRSLAEDHGLRRPMLARAVGHQEFRAAWANHVDAFFYIEEGTPVTSVRRP